LIACLAGFAPALRAQTVHFSGAVLTLGSGFRSTLGVAVDRSGNVFVADYFGNTVKEIVAAGGYTTVKTVGSGFGGPRGVAVDASGNLFVADSGNNAVKEFVAAGGYTTVNTLGGGFNFPTGVAVDASGNVFVADAYNNAVKEILAAGGYTAVNTLGSGFNTPNGVAVDGSGNVFVADSYNYALKEIVAAGGYTTVKTLASGFSTIGVAVDASGNIFFAESNELKELVAAGGYTTSNTLGSGCRDPLGVAVDGSGNVFVADYGHSAVKEIVAAGGQFSSVNVGTSSANPVSLAFAFDSDGALGSSTVVTQGTAGLDFTKAAGSTCTAGKAYAAGQSCLVNVALKPKHPGPRYGAVELLDTSGNLLATGYVQGTGVGPQVSFSRIISGVYQPSGQKTLGSGFDRPYGIAVDGKGNAFISDTYNNAVKEVMAAGDYTTVKTLGSGFSFPTGVAIDGSGNLFVADSDNNAIEELLAAGGYTTIKSLGSGFNRPAAVAVDGSGNVFVADQNNSAVKEIVAAGGYTTIITLGSGFDLPAGVAVDGSGNVFVSDTYNDAVKEILAAGGYTTINTLGSGLHRPAGLMVDGNGNVFVADSENNAVKEILAAGGYTTIHTLGSGFNLPGAVAQDGNGNVFVADLGNSRALRLNFADPSPLHFAPTAIGSKSSDSPRSVTVTNIGNAALTFPVPSSGTNPSVPAGFELAAATTCPNLSTTSAAGTLAKGNSCVYAMDFVPAVPGGALSAQLTLTDNNLNAAGPTFATQHIGLNGTSAPFGYFGQAVDGVTLTSTVSQSHKLLVQGWVFDPQDGAPLSNVTVNFDGASIGTPTLGIARPDVAAAYGSAYLDSGYKLLYPASSLALGTHQVTVVAIDSSGQTTTFGPRTITVVP
jgi:streptogramin lyase